MQHEDFNQFLKHFPKRSSIERKRKEVLLLLDNHDSHLHIENINFCKANGIILLTFPPHTSHRLQPLYRGGFGPLKRYVNSASDSWMKNNPGRAMTIYDIPEISQNFPTSSNNSSKHFIRIQSQWDLPVRQR